MANACNSSTGCKKLSSKKKGEIRDESGTKQKDEIATIERAGPLQLLVLNAVLLSFTTSLTQPISLFFEHVRLSFTLTA